MTKKNDNFQTVAGVLKEASSVLLYPHISPDGDAIGSTVAMARVLRQLGKTCYVVTEDEIPENLQFLDHGYTMPIGEVSDVPTVSMCIDCGVDVNRMNVELYESQRPERMRIEAQVMNNMKLSADGKFAMAYVTRAMMEENDVRSGDTDAVVANLRSIRGVEVAAFFKEKADDEIKLSLRAKGNCDVAAIAMAFGGGGHRKASGATLTMSLQEAIDAVTEKVLKSIADEE